jgi:hypothetical protein
MPASHPAAGAAFQECPMQRRQFLRIAGGGAVFAAAPLALGGCSESVPAVAVAAWQPPAETELRRWALSHAILAPHSHNLQSWLVDLSEPGTIVLRCDRERLLPATDPFSRQIMMSHGTFLELLDLALRERGHRAETVLFPEGEFGPERIDDRPVARIRVVADAGVRPDALFAHVFARRTIRSTYEPGRAVPAAAWAAMAAACASGASGVADGGLHFGHVGLDDTAALAQHRAIADEAWRIELTTPAAIMESFAVLRIGRREIAEHRDGIALTAAMPVWMNRLGLFDRSRVPAPGDRAVQAQIDGFQRATASTPGFLWMVSADNRRPTQIDAGRAWMRVHLAATAQGVALHPLQQALQEYPEQRQPHAAIHRLLGAEAPGQTVQMWARAGFAPAPGPAPRRGLQAHIVAG